jgi:putative ABC transport system permease protein
MSMGLMLSDLKESGKAADSIFNRMKSSGLQLFDRGSKTENGAVTPFQAMMRNQKKEKWEGIKYRILTIDDIMSQARQIVTALDTSSLVILVVLFFIIMVGITNTFRMVMYERIREIGTMRAVGVQRSEIRGLFLYEALFLAIGGAVSGIIISLILMGILSLFNFGMDSPVFLIMKNGHLSFFVPPLRAVFNVLLIAALTLAAAFFPARNAARLEPAEALRTQK